MVEHQSKIENRATHATAEVEHHGNLEAIKKRNDIGFRNLPIQCKLSVGAVDDPLEKEADNIADQVMRMPENGLIQRKCSQCEEEDKAMRKPLSSFIQRMPDDYGGMPASKTITNSVNSSRGTGNTMDTKTQSFMQSRFGTDFSNVKIHTNGNAIQMNRDLNAKAFTVGDDIYFNRGQYNPSTNEGKHLLAHELTHMVQQTDSPIVQKFGATEHKTAGDEASKAFSSNKKKPLEFKFIAGSVPFVLTFGDITMLSGDLFDPRDSIPGANGKPMPNPDSLFLIAAKPSSNPGLMPGTQDEIIFAIYDNDKKDPRFLKGGIWEVLPDIFNKKDPATKELLSKNVRKAVGDRYLKLAAKNYEHFVQPSRKDLGPLAGLGNSAGGSYRVLHEDAILMAYHAAQKGAAASEGLMREAAAQHFLQDSFAAGHLRTPRLAIDKHWLKKIPLFFENMKKKIALDMAIYINDRNDVATYALTVSIYYDNIYADVQKQTKGFPPIGFGAILSEVIHHNDNKLGVWVTNRLGHKWRDFGDGHLNKSYQPGNIKTYKYANNRTPDMIGMAVKLGIEDIQSAYLMGKGSKTVIPDASVLERVRKKGTNKFNKPIDLYAPEMTFPQLDTTKDDGSIDAWRSSSIDELWNLQVRTDKPETYGQLITKSFRSGEGSSQLLKMEEEVPKIGKLGARPQDAFKYGFRIPLQQHPLEGLKSIIDYNPSIGQAGFNEDDAVREEMEKMNERQIKGFTLKQRADRINNLTDGTFNAVDHDDGELVIKLFEMAASHKERLQLYQMVEGHTWEGKWKEGFWKNDDDIWNGLERGQLKRLRIIINKP